MKKNLYFFALVSFLFFGCSSITEQVGLSSYDIRGFNKEGIHRDTGTIYNTDGFKKNGFNIEGFNTFGINKYTQNRYNKDGYNTQGYDKNGFDINGYNRDKYNKDGYNFEGYDKNGFDINGYNNHTKGKYDKNGFDINGYNIKGLDKFKHRRQDYRNVGISKKEFIDLSSTKYEKEFAYELFELVKDTKKRSHTYIQPINKKVPCKLYVENDDAFLKNLSHKNYWYGKCKKGYASGLGREVEKGNSTNKYQISIYEKGRAKGLIYVNNLLKESISAGENNEKTNTFIGVTRKVDYHNGDIFMKSFTGKINFSSEEKLFVTTTPFSNSLVYAKGYKNFIYYYNDSSKEELSPYKYLFMTQNKKYEDHGYGKIVSKEGKTRFINMENNKFIKYIYDPYIQDRFLNKGEDIKNEIEPLYKKALEVSKKAILLKEQYVKKSCKKNIKVNFLNNKEYKNICNNEYEKILSTKVSDKLQRVTNLRVAKIKQIKQERNAYNQEQNRQKFLDEQKRLADQKFLTEQKRVKAEQEKANFFKALGELSNSLQEQRKAQINSMNSIINSMNTNSSFQNNNTTTYKQRLNKINRYKGYSGNQYKYDLSKQNDRIKYQYDYNSQINDSYNQNTGHNIDRSLGQYGAGYIK